MPENKYVEMICHLAEQPKTEAPPPEGFEVRPLSTADNDSLYPCYYAAFQAGDARFFFDQGEAEKRAYFDTLGLAEARNEPGSTLILKDSAIVGFTYVIPYREANRHISCMVVHPGYQRQGLGAFMVQYAIRNAAAGGCKSITLGTDTTMGAFQLYRKHGFEILEK